MSRYLLWILLGGLLLSASCSVQKKLTYFNDLPEHDKEIIDVYNKVDQTIVPGDVLSITVNTLNAESNTLFNQGVLSSASASGSGSVKSPATEGFRVDKAGNINYPVLGKVFVQGKTLEQVQSELSTLISKEVKNPIVNVRLLNAKVMVIGEVGSPGPVDISERETTILEALGLAGDIQPTGRKDNVLLIRDNGSKKEFVRLNMNQKATINSEYYYLKQNDIILVEPTMRKERQEQGYPEPTRTVTLAFSIASFAMGLYMFFHNLTKN